MTFKYNLAVFKGYNPDIEKMQKALFYALMFIAVISVISNTFIGFGYGLKTVLIIVAAMVTSVEMERLFYWHNKRQTREKSTALIKQTYPVNTGLLIGLLMPVGAPITVVVICSAFAIYIVRNAFGGFSYNIFNVAVAARVFYELSWSDIPAGTLNQSAYIDNLILLIFKTKETGINFAEYFNNLYSLNPDSELFLNIQQLLFNEFSLIMLGAVTPIALIIVFIFLMIKRVVKIEIIISYVISVALMFGVLIVLNYATGLQIVNYLIISPLLLIVLFYLTDNATSGKTINANILYTMVVVIISIFMGFLATTLVPILFAILFANMLMPIINQKVENKKSLFVLYGLTIFLAVLVFFMIIGADESAMIGGLINA